MNHKLLLLAAILSLSLGCKSEAERMQLVYQPDRNQPVPVVDLPESIRVENWVGRDQDGDSGGSCVHASTINCFRGAARHDLEARWISMRGQGYEGPETANRISQKLVDSGVPYIRTTSADANVLDAATRTRRPGIIFYYQSHCVNFIGFDVVNGKEVAILLDNNFTDKYIVIDRKIFDKSWKYYGGFALIPWVEPMVPRTYPRAIPRDQMFPQGI